MQKHKTVFFPKSEKKMIILSQILDGMEVSSNYDESFLVLKNVITEHKLKYAYEIFRANYFLRTKHTTIFIALTLKNALQQSDTKAAALLTHNLFEEMGEGDPLKSHMGLLEQSCNILGKRLFDTNDLYLKDIENSPLILHSTRQYVANLLELYSDTNYLLQLGCLLAHERAASNMLQRIYSSVFKPHLESLAIEDVKNLKEYFDCHLNRVEDRHGKDMLEIVLSKCDNKSAQDHILAGIQKYHQLQSNLWSEMAHVTAQSVMQLSSL